MGRTVLVGTQAAPYTLAAADLPPDGSLRDSFWRWVTVPPALRDLSAWDCRDMTVADCNLAGVTVTSTVGIVSRRCRWNGAALPASVTADQHDLVFEILRQNYVALSAADKAVADQLRALVAADTYRHSWRDVFPAMMAATGLTARQLGEWAIRAWAGYPRIQRMAVYIAAHPDEWAAAPEPTTAIIRVHAPDGYREFDLTGTALVDDRWALAQAVATRLENHYGEPFHVRVLEVDPILSVRAVAASRVASLRDGWWRRNDV